MAPLGSERAPRGKHGHLRLTVGAANDCAGIEPADPFFARVNVLVRQTGWQPGPAAHVLLVGDGGEWIWNRAAQSRQQGSAVDEILDLYHAREHVWEVVHALLGTDLTAHQWGEELCETMLEKGGAVVIEAFAKLHPRTKYQRELLEQATEYFRVNLTHMDYPTYAANSWPLGSGIVESACRLICGLRCKQPGMRWSLRGAQNVLALRALALSAVTTTVDLCTSIAPAIATTTSIGLAPCCGRGNLSPTKLGCVLAVDPGGHKTWCFRLPRSV